MVLTTACYLAKAGLKVVVVERHDYVGGAAVSRELHPGWTYSNCSYVCSLLRPEIFRDLELSKHGLQIIPYEGSASMLNDGRFYAHYQDHDLTYRSIAQFSKKDAEAYDRFGKDVMRQCKIIKPLLKMTPPDPTSFKPKDIMGLFEFAKYFAAKDELGGLGEKEIYDTIRFWTMSVRDYLEEYFESDIVKVHLSWFCNYWYSTWSLFSWISLRSIASLYGRSRWHCWSMGLFKRRNGINYKSYGIFFKIK